MQPNQDELTLTGWVAAILVSPRSVLNKIYRDCSDSYTELEPLFNKPAETHQISDDLLSALHKHLRGARSENNIWDGVVSFCKRPLPDDIAHDLIDREIAIAALGHSRQSDEVQYLLALFYDEALLTLAFDLYSNPFYPLEQFEDLLKRVGAHTWMMDSLLRRTASSPEKHAVYMDAVHRHPEAARFLAYLKRQELAKKAQSDQLGEEEIAELFATNDSLVWSSLAFNPLTPTAILRQFADLPAGSLGKAARNEARMQIEARARISPDRISPDQAAQILAAMRLIGKRLADEGDPYGYSKVYRALFERYNISHHRNLLGTQFEDAIAWLQTL